MNYDRRLMALSRAAQMQYPPEDVPLWALRLEAKMDIILERLQGTAPNTEGRSSPSETTDKQTHEAQDKSQT